MRMIAFAALLAATPALAQEPPTTIQAGVTRGTFDRAGDVDRYRFLLKQGKDYAFGVGLGEDADSQWTLRAPGGATLFSDVAGQGSAAGFEFRAKQDGYFTLEGKAGGASSYTIRFHPDCLASTKTRCRIKPGITQGHTLAAGVEQDWIRLTNLSAGRSYTATATAEFDGLTLSVLDASGKLLIAGGSDKNAVTFKGGVFLAIDAEDDLSGRGYQLTLR